MIRPRSLTPAVVGLTIGAAVVGLVWLLAGGTSAESVGKAPLVAPTRLGNLLRYSDTPLSHRGPGIAIAKRHAEWDKRSARLLSDANDGAATMVEEYEDREFANGVLLTAVRAHSPRPFVPYTDATVYDLVRPPDEVQQFGDVFCRLRNLPTQKGKTPAADSVITVRCQRTDSMLTVAIDEAVGERLSPNPAAVAALVDEAWRDLT